MFQRELSLSEWISEPLKAERPLGVPFPDFKRKVKAEQKERVKEICQIMDCTPQSLKLYLTGKKVCPILRGQAAANYFKQNVWIGSKIFIYFG